MQNGKLKTAKFVTLGICLVTLLLWILSIRYTLNIALSISKFIVAIISAIMLFTVCVLSMINQRKSTSKVRKLIFGIILAVLASCVFFYSGLRLIIDYAVQPYIKIDNQMWEDGEIESQYAKRFLPSYEEISGHTAYSFYVNANYDYPFSHRDDQFEEAYLLEITYTK